MATKTIKMSDDSAKLYDDMFAARKAESPELTAGQFFEELLNAVPTEEPSTNFVISYPILSALDIELPVGDNPTQVILDAIQTIKQRAMSVPSSVEVERQIGPDEYLLHFPEMHLKLMKIVSERLSAIAGEPVSPGDILLDMFLRYELQRNSEWFYPWVIKDSEFVSLLGVSRKQLLEVL